MTTKKEKKDQMSSNGQDCLARLSESFILKMTQSFSGLSFATSKDFEIFSHKSTTILSLNGLTEVADDGTNIIKRDYDELIFNLFSLSMSGEPMEFFKSIKGMCKGKASLMIPLLEKEYGSTSESSQMSIQGQLKALSFEGHNLKLFLQQFENIDRRLVGKFILPYETKLHLIKTALSGSADLRNDIKWAERAADGNWTKFMAEMRVTAQEIVDTNPNPTAASAMVLYVANGGEKKSAGKSQQTDNGLLANLNVMPCYFCKMPNHTVTTCGHVEKARFTFGYPSAKPKVPAAPVKVAAAKPYRNTAKKAVADHDEPSFSITSAQAQEYAALKANAVHIALPVISVLPVIFKCAAVNTNGTNEIVINPDSMSNVNICGDRTLFINLKKSVTPLIGIANAQATEQGEISLQLQTTAGTMVTCLINALYVESYPKKSILLSTCKFFKAGGAFTQNKDGALLTTRDGLIIACKIDANDLPYCIGKKTE
jgi:hypothetical protein